MGKKNLISITDFSQEEILKIMELATRFEADTSPPGASPEKVIAPPSSSLRPARASASRARSTALGGRVIGFSETANTSVSKGETFHDTIVVISNYCDLIVMRHSIEGAEPATRARYRRFRSVRRRRRGQPAPEAQTLLDLYSIQKTQGTLDGLHIAMVGDLKYGRTVHSLLQAMSFFNPTFTFVAPDELKMPDEYKLFLDEKGIP